MKKEIDPQLQAIADACETEAEIRAAVDALSQEERMRIVYESIKNQAYADVRAWGVAFIDLIDQEQIVNNYRTQTANRSPMVGSMLACSKLIEMSAGLQARQELQAQDADGHTQFGMELANKIDDYAQVIHRNVSDLMTLSCHYESVLAGRRMGFHFVSEDGKGVPLADVDQSN